MGLFQPTHLILILVIVLVVFGAGRLPELGSAVGKTIRGFKDSVRELHDESPSAATVAACATCGAHPHPGQRFCGECGTALAKALPKP